ncbi:MAG: TolC family protein [Gemmatimonadaceae bacterium]|nr:TolC family protein [Gemmatimonadaceae bacterium]
MRQSLNARRSAAAATRSARGQLLPNLSSNAGVSWREGRQQVFNGVGFGANANTIGSNAGINASLNYGLDVFLQPKASRFAERATEAEADAASQQLRATVTQQYLIALQAQARSILQDTLLESNRLTVELARARLAAGSATTLDVQRAEVALGQQRVQVVQARNTLAIEKLRLFENLGVQPPADVSLTSTFAVAAVGTSLADLLELSRRSNPNVIARRDREDAAAVNQRIARSAYLPQLSLQAGYGGFTNSFTDNNFPVSQALASAQGSCFQRGSILTIVGQPFDPATCTSITLTPAQIAAARATNSAFPFSLTRNPYNVSAQFSLPLFNGWQREQRIAEASVARDNAKQAVRQQELAAQQAVRTAYLNLDAAQQTVAIQEENGKLAREALLLAETRYRVGQATFLDVANARADFSRAENDRITAVYDFHRAFAALEQAVGRRLR